MDRPAFRDRRRGPPIERFAQSVEEPAQRLAARPAPDRPPGALHRHAAGQPFGVPQSDGADGSRAEVVGDFKDDVAPAVVEAEGLVDRGQGAGEIHLHDGAAHGGQPAGLDFRTAVRGAVLHNNAHT